MATIIDGSYFIDNIMIPQAYDSSTEQTATDVLYAIQKHEIAVLDDLLGYKLRKALFADLDGNGEPQSQRFKDLINGSEFTIEEDDNRLCKWKGFRNSEKDSLIAYYVYYQYVYQYHIHLSGVGSVNYQAENGEKATPFDKLEIAWRNFMQLYSAFDFETNEAYFYEDGMKVSDLPGILNYYPTAYNFLYVNADEYPEWIFKPQYNKNIFSL
jgi:hypothetical protein